MKSNTEVFSPQIVNTGRQNELDLAKAVLIFCLALTHCFIECTPDDRLVSGLPYLFDSIIGGPLGAPMFMFAMGVGMAYSKKRSPAYFLRRGIQIGLISYALNICRFLIPFLIGYAATGNYEKFISPLMYRVLGDDILQFAAVSLFCMALFIKLKLSKSLMLIISLIMSAVGTLLVGVDTGEPLSNIFLGYIIGTEDAAGMVFSDFPLLNWLIVPVAGYIFGHALKHVQDKRRFYGVLSTIGVLISVIYFPIGILNGWGMFGEGQNCYYHISTFDVLISLAATIGILGIYFIIVKFIPQRAMNLISETSRNINSVYCIHWVIVIFCTNIFLYIARGTQYLPSIPTLLMASAISVVSITIAHFWSKYKASGRH